VSHSAAEAAAAAAAAGPITTKEVARNLLQGRRCQVTPNQLIHFHFHREAPLFKKSKCKMCLEENKPQTRGAHK
jgi:hypothetical protein